MKRSLFIFIAMLLLYACNKPVEVPMNGMPNINNDIEKLLDEQQGDVDVTNLESMLCAKAIEMEYYLDENKETKEQHKRFVFNEDGTCRILLHRVVDKVVGEDNDGSHIWNEVDEYYYSRVYNWTLDKESKVLTTSDNYGNIHTATIIYLGEDVMIYDGCIGDELRSNESVNNYRTLVKFVADREAWTDVAVSYDVEFRLYADENDLRLQRMLDLVDNASDNVNTDLFIDALLTKVIAMEYDPYGKESGCSYGDVSMYVYEQGAYLYRDLVEGGALPGILVMSEDGKYKECFTTDILDLSGPHNVPEGSKLYLEYDWSFNKENNTLFTYGSYDNGAEVLFVDDNVAILKGHICGYPYNGEYGLFYIVFNKYDRESILKEYNTNYLDLI